MLIGIIADTHDNLVMIARAMREMKARGVEVLLHAGDYAAPFALKALLEPGLPLIGVFGNVDGEKEGLRKVHADIFEEPHRFELGGRVIVLAHRPEVLEASLRPGDDLGIHGHTHEPLAKLGPPLIVNPGEAGGWVSGRATAAAVDLANVSAEIIEFGTVEREAL